MSARNGGGAESAEATDHRKEPSRAMRFRLRILSKNSIPIQATDLRSLGPTHQCVCGSTVFNCFVQFEDYDICWWALDAQCASCGNLVKVPCPVDKPE
jgi:hypothetical protein